MTARRSLDSVRSRALAALAPFAFFAGLALVPRTLAAQATDALLNGFEPAGEWLLVVDGREAPKARIYYAKRAQALLVRSAEFPSPVLVDVAGRSVATLDLMKISERSDGTLDLLADAVLEPAGRLEMGATGAAFALAGKRAELRNAPHLTGPHDGADLLEHDAHYRFLADRYQPDANALGRLRTERRNVRVLTFFGSWCPHCREHVPLLLKVEKLLDGSSLDFDYVGLPQVKVSEEPEAKQWGVTGVPTAIVLIDGKEVGRMPGSGWKQPEAALAALIAPGASAAATRQ